MIPPIVAYTHAARAAEYAITQQAFANLGLEIAYTAYQTKAPSGMHNRQNALTALLGARRYHRHAGSAGVLMIEDDITPSPHLPAWLEWIEARHPFAIVTLYTPNDVVRWIPERHHDIMRGRAKATQGALVKSPNPRGYWGAQALWLPWELTDVLAADPRITANEQPGIGPWDTAIRQTLLMERGVPLLVTIPAIVQHRAPRNLVSAHRNPHAAASYDAEVPPPPHPAIGE